MWDELIDSSLLKASNETILVTLEHLINTAQDKEAVSFLKSITKEFCEEFNFCPSCKWELEERSFNRGWETGDYCPQCERVYNRREAV